MTGFLGSYQHQIDEKGRLSLPASFRRDGGEEPMVLVHAFPDALTLYPRATWIEVEARLREMLRLNPQARPYVLARDGQRGGGRARQAGAHPGSASACRRRWGSRAPR